MTTDGLISRSIDVPGAKLHYEVRGNGPALLVIGSPMAASEFAPLAHAMATDHTVITYDPRGFAASPVADPGGPSNPDLRADDVVAILDDLGVESADVFGSSGGAVTGLAMVVRYPGRVGTLVAHEPPLIDLLPDAAAQREAMHDITEVFLTEGLPAAWMRFMVNAGFDLPSFGDGPPEPQGEPVNPEQALAEGGPLLRPRPGAHLSVPARLRRVAGLAVTGPDRPRHGVGAAADAPDIGRDS